MLLQQTFAWASEMKPSQPLTVRRLAGQLGRSGEAFSRWNGLQLEHSDMIRFHNYGHVDDLRPAWRTCTAISRPIICTEYMARPVGSTFDPNMRFMKEQNVGAYNWGFVSGQDADAFSRGIPGRRLTPANRPVVPRHFPRRRHAVRRQGSGVYPTVTGRTK